MVLKKEPSRNEMNNTASSWFPSLFPHLERFKRTFVDVLEWDEMKEFVGKMKEFLGAFLVGFFAAGFFGGIISVLLTLFQHLLHLLQDVHSLKPRNEEMEHIKIS